MNLLLRALALLGLFAVSLQAAPLSGTRSVGPTGDFPSLTAAIANVQAGGNGLGGALVLELQATYVSAVETFPLTIPALQGASAVNTLAIRPATGATALAISSAAAQTVDLNGAQFVTFDGRPGGVGAASQLTIANTSVSGMALRFINEASSNALRSVALRGVNISVSSGTVVFSTSTGANGNDDNVIDHCDIRDGASTPANGIYALGSTGSAAQNNSGNTVSNCNVFNFYSNSAVDAAGVRLDGGNTDWTITGNSFYQTASRVAVGANVRAIYVNNTSGNHFTATGNSIGGSAPNVGGTAWTTTGTSAAHLFQGIVLNVGTTVASSVQGNTVANFVWTSSSNAALLPGVWSGIYVQAGNADVGTIAGNTIGSGTGTGSVSVSTSGNSGATFGIGSASSGTVAIAKNVIGSITTSGTTTSVSSSIIGIRVTAGANTIASNTVGSATTASSLSAPTAAGDTGGVQQITGILSTSSGSANISGNTVANFNNNTISTVGTSQVRGISTSAGANTITGNTVRNLSTTSKTSGIAALGIEQISTTAGQTVSQNVVHSLSDTDTTNGVVVVGIYYAGNTTAGPNIIARNLVHSLSVVSSDSQARVIGMAFDTGTFTAQNNMVSVGLTASGASMPGTGGGISDGRDTPGRRFYHNSVYVGGTQTTGTSGMTAFSSSGTTNERDFRNNIFFNARSGKGNNSGTARHYAVRFEGAVSTAGLTSDNNIYLVTGVGGVLAYYNSVDRGTLSALQTTSGVDLSSLSADPLFVNPTGTAATLDLHVLNQSPAEGSGAPIASVADDYDGQTRSALTPADIGADAGDFGLGLTYPLLGFGSVANRVLTGWASIASSSAVASGASAPRFYFKKAAEADVFGGNTSASNGWKYVTASNGSSPYSFTVNYALLSGGGVSSGDTIQFFVAAQDTAGNFRSAPWGAATSASPPVQNVSAKPTNGVNSYRIVDTMSGTVTVGPGGSFPGLSGAGGLFAALNSRVLSGNLTVNITGNTTEDGSVVFNPVNSNSNYPSTNAFSVTIRPGGATMRTISGAAFNTNGLISLNGAQRVTIDGSFGGSGRYLTFRNTNSSGPTLVFINDASNNAVRNCVIEGATNNNGLGVLVFAGGVTTGNDNNTVEGNQIRDRSDAVGVPENLVYVGGSSDKVSNSNNAFLNNELFNFTQTGVYMNYGCDSWSITGNTIYQTTARTTGLTGIRLSCLGTNTIQGNTVRDLTTTNGAIGISVNEQTGSTTVAGNRIWNLGNAAGSTSLARGIYATPGAGQSVTLVNNMIALSSFGITAQALVGIYDSAASGGTVVTASNTVLITGSGGAGKDTWAFTRTGTSSATVKDNVFLNLRTGGGNHFAVNQLTTSTGALAMDYNVYAGTGLTAAANFFDASNGTGSVGTPISYAQWKANVPSDTHSSASTPGGNYTSAMFVNAATGDLHLVPGGNPLVNNAGTPVPGVTTDFDSQARSGTTPDIGADELITNANLSGLALSSGTLSPAFTTSTANYTAAVSSATTTLLVMPTVADPDATITVNSTSPATPVALNIGANTISILVTAQDGTTTKLYSVVITRRTVFQDWAGANGVAGDPNATGANGLANLFNFAFGINPATGGNGELQYAGTLAGGGTIAATGLPRTWFEPSGSGVDFRALFVRRKDYVAAGLTYTPQFSVAMTTWVNSAAVPTVLADDGVNQIVSVPYPAFIGGKKARFFRISVTLAP